MNKSLIIAVTAAVIGGAVGGTVVASMKGVPGTSAAVGTAASPVPVKSAEDFVYSGPVVLATELVGEASVPPNDGSLPIGASIKVQLIRGTAGGKYLPSSSGVRLLMTGHNGNAVMVDEGAFIPSIHVAAMLRDLAQIEAAAAGANIDLVLAANPDPHGKASGQVRVSKSKSANAYLIHVSKSAWLKITADDYAKLKALLEQAKTTLDRSAT